MKKSIVTLSLEERKQLNELTSKEKHQSQRIFQALILLDCDMGVFQTGRLTNEETARVLNISIKNRPCKKVFCLRGL